MKKARYSLSSFKDLKGIFDKSPSIVFQGDKTDQKTEEEIFREAMSDVREIREYREIPFKKQTRVMTHQIKKDDSMEILGQIVRGKKKIRLSDTGEYIEWVSPRIRKDIVHRLHQGDFSVQDFIDLHGLTLDEAEKAFNTFIKEAVKKGLFCIKVIHGRGIRSPKGPVLKDALKKWLHGTFRKWVLAYSTAKDCDGGLGATYIILRSK